MRKCPTKPSERSAGTGGLLLLLLLLLEEHAAQDLADERLGERVAELDLLGHAVPGQVAPAPLDDLLGRGLLALPEHDERLHCLTGGVVRYPDHGDLLDLGVPVQ